MTDTVIIGIIGGVTQIVVAALVTYSTIVVRRTETSVKETSNVVQALEKNTNGMKAELVDLTRASAFQRGVQVGKDPNKEPVKDPGVQK